MRFLFRILRSFSELTGSLEIFTDSGIVMFFIITLVGVTAVSALWGTDHEIVLPLLNRGSFIQIPTLSGNITTHDIFKFSVNDQLLNTETAHIRVKRRSRRSRNHRAHRRHNHRRNRMTTAAAANCLNEARNCPNLMGHCMGSGAVHTTVTQYCTLNCGLCAPTMDKCRDFSHNCGQWKQQGFCKHNNPNFTEQRMFCARTCGKCAKQPKADKKKEAGKAKPPPKTQPPSPKPTPVIQKHQPVKPPSTTPDNADCKADPEEL